MAWSQPPSTWLSLRRFGPGAEKLEPMLSVDLGSSSAGFATVWDGTQYQLVTAEVGGVFARRVAATGVLLDTQPTSIAANATAASIRVASNGKNSLTVWVEARDGASGIYGARVAPNGSVFDPGGTLVASAARDPQLVAAGEHYMVVWTGGETSGLWATLVPSDGALVDLQAIPIGVGSASHSTPTISWNGNQALVAWKSGSKRTRSSESGEPSAIRRRQRRA